MRDFNRINFTEIIFSPKQAQKIIEYVYTMNLEDYNDKLSTY